MSSIGSMFTASSVKLTKLLDDCHTGQLQLPEFQRSWVWDEERIKSLIASVSRGFPIGAVMTLGTGGNVTFQPRMIEGSEVDSGTVRPDALLLDGQQRLTSLYQVLVRGDVIHTVTPRKQKVARWFYIDINRALDSTIDREEAVVSVPPEKQILSFGRKVEMDISTRELEIENMMFPVSMILNWHDWQKSYIDRYSAEPDFQERFRRISDFHDLIIQNVAGYLVPVIELDKSTSKEAVCVVFEKVNTGGKSLDAFELITAMYAAEGYELRKDWYDSPGKVGRQRRLRDQLRMPSASGGVLGGVGNTDFLQVISLFHTRDLREQAAISDKTGKEQLPQVSINRQALLNLPLDAYKKYQDKAEYGFNQAAKFLIKLGVFKVRDLPYQSQVVPIAAILAELGERAEEASIARKLTEWYWNGVFGELYGSSTETRVAKDFIEVLKWVDGGDAPATVHNATVRADRLRTMRMRQSAAYKGVNALLMNEGAKDFRTGQAFTHTVFFDENVDIHHIFPKDWCKKQGIESKVYDSIINKTPLTSRTNRIIGGSAPSAYLKALEGPDAESAPTQREGIDTRLRTHLIDPELLRSDGFDKFMKARQAELVRLIENATGKPVIPESPSIEFEEYVEEDEHEDAAA